MKICLLLNNWGTWGGSAVYHDALVRGLRSRGVDVRVAIPFNKELWDLPTGLNAMVGFEKSIKALQACSTWVLWGIGKDLSIRMLLGRKRTPPRIIAINHGGSDNKWSKDCLSCEAKFAHSIVGVSKDSLGAIPAEHLHKGVVISGAVERDRLVPVVSASDMRSSLGLKDGDKVAMYIGRIAKEKRVELAIEAMRYMPENWKLLVVGEANDHIHPRCLYNNHRVQFCGPSAFPGDYLQLADCFVSPSASEGFGFSVVEAIAFGVPVVAHKVGVLSEFDLATTIPPKSNPQAYAAAILRAEKDRAKALSDKEFVSSLFSMSSFLESWSDLL